MSRLNEASFFMASHDPLVVTTSVSGPYLSDTEPVLRDRITFASDAEYRAYLEREQA
jgi:hypothetical protein